MVPLWFLSREVLVQGNPIHARRAVEKVSGRVNPSNPRVQLARPVHRDDPQEGVNRFGGGDEADSTQPGEGQLQLLPQDCGSPVLAKSTRTPEFPHVNMDEGGGGVKTLCPLHHLPHQQAPRVCGPLQHMRAAGEGEEVRQATMLQKGHCKRNHSCAGARRHGKVLNLKNTVHIRVNYMRMLARHAYEKCEYAHEFNNLLRI